MENTFGNRDKSMVPTPSGVAVPKRERYSWTTESAPGQFKLVSKDDLNIDTSYQRDEVSKNKVMEIARSWDWKLFGALSVVMRDDGSLWVYDGGHRTRAAFYRDDISYLPCMVFRVEDTDDEAKAFVGANTMKSNVSAFHVYRASVKAKEPVAIATKKLLDKFGYEAALDSRKAYGLAAISTLLKMVKEDAQLAERVFSLCVEMALEGEQIPGTVLRAIFTLAKKLDGKADILAGNYRHKLKKEGIAGAEAAMRREKHITGQGGQTIEARAILNLLNKGKHKKLNW